MHAEPVRHEVTIGLGSVASARVLGTTEGAVKLRAFRGYEKLRAALADLLREDA